MRPLGDITLDLEVLLDEMIDDHELQAQELIGLIWIHLMSHRLDCFPQYLDGDKLDLYVGPSQYKPYKGKE